MKIAKKNILTINGGSSSIKFSLYEVGTTLERLLHGEIENIGTKNAKFHFIGKDNHQIDGVGLNAINHGQGATHLMEWLGKRVEFTSVVAIGHRIVHGMNHTDPELITDKLMKELKKVSAFDPEHLPAELELIEVFRTHYPELQQIACFDTSFHTSMPVVAKLLALPRRYFEMSIHRYGFHGLSYTFLMESLERMDGKKTAKGKVILAHLGSGASLAAVKNGKSIDTSMGFTPTGGLPMSTRTGDLDPGAVWFLIKQENLSPQKLSTLINHKSGLLGISETNADVRELIKIEGKDVRAKEAIDFFCYQTKKWIGSFAAALGGLDVLVFSGGIGENSHELRARICENLTFLGIHLDDSKNRNNDSIISSAKSTVKVRVIKTDEEFIIAKFTCKVLNIDSN
ncbi:acetate kinase [Pedobacter sp. UYEF25]